jgi:hypothetical protein
VIAKLNAATMAVPAPPPVMPASIPAAVAVEASGKRRRVTVMFCDLAFRAGVSGSGAKSPSRQLIPTVNHLQGSDENLV